MQISGKPRRSEDWARLPLSLQRPSAVGRDSEDFQVSISCCRPSILSETSLRGAVFVLQGRKQGMPKGEVHLYDEEHYLTVGPQGAAMISALQQRGASGNIVQSLARLRETYGSDVSVTPLASDANMSVPSYHAHFKALTGSSPMQYVKACGFTRPD